MRGVPRQTEAIEGRVEYTARVKHKAATFDTRLIPLEVDTARLHGHSSNDLVVHLITRKGSGMCL